MLTFLISLTNDVSMGSLIIGSWIHSKCVISSTSSSVFYILVPAIAFNLHKLTWMAMRQMAMRTKYFKLWSYKNRIFKRHMLRWFPAAIIQTTLKVLAVRKLWLSFLEIQLSVLSDMVHVVMSSRPQNSV